MGLNIEIDCVLSDLENHRFLRGLIKFCERRHQ